MKVAQKIPTNPNTWSTHLSHSPSMLNMEHSPSGHLSDTGPEPGIPSQLNSPFICFVQHYVRTFIVLRIAMLCLVMLCLLCIYCFSRLFSSVDPVAATDATVIDYVTDDPSFLSEQPGKPSL